MREDQRKAQAAVDEALKALLKAYNRGEEDREMRMVTWVVVTERIELDDSGEVCGERMDVLTSHGARLSTTRGLLEMAPEGLVADCEAD